MRIRDLAVALLAVSSPAMGEGFYVRTEYSIAHFERADESTRAIERKLNSEGVSTSVENGDTAAAFAPVLGYMVSDNVGIEFSGRQYIWTTNARGVSGPTNLIPSDGGAPVPVQSVDFRSTAQTDTRLLQLGVSYTPRVWRGSALMRLAAVHARTCSSVYEVSDNEVTGTGLVRTESRAGACRAHLTGSVTAGYTYATRNASFGGYLEVIREIGNRGVVYVDGGGTGNTYVPVIGVTARMMF